MTAELYQSAYVFALSQVEGLGPRTLLRVLDVFPTAEAFADVSPELAHDKLGVGIPPAVRFRLVDQWRRLLASAYQVVSRHLEKGITPIPITASCYPPLLRLISDPPPMLFVKGHIETLGLVNMIAIVGTRDATTRGKDVASRISKYFGQHGFVIVSGLAKGIDTAAHCGALDAGAKTIAVLGTALDQIYPAENKELAERIASGGNGALISELAMGKKSFRNAFVQRDRIQSGMSLAVVPVQTDVTGGTMHTVRFAEAQNRLLLCPKPLAIEQNLKQYAGIIDLVRNRRAREFQAEDYASLLTLLQDRRRELLTTDDDGALIPKISQHRNAVKQSEQDQLDLVSPPVKSDQQNQEVDKLIEAVKQLGFDASMKLFDSVTAEVRKRIFGEKRGARRKSANGSKTGRKENIVSQEQTPLQWAREEFSKVSGELVLAGFLQLSETQLVRDEEPPGERRIDVGFFGDPQNPHIRVVNQPKPNLLPSLSGEEPASPRAYFFDATKVGSEFGWLERNRDEGLITAYTLQERISRLVATA